MVLFPGMLFMALRHWRRQRDAGFSDKSIGAWLRSGWSGASRWHDLYHYVAFGYFAKDLIIPLTTEIFVHHVLCTFLAGLSLWDPPAMPKWCVKWPPDSISLRSRSARQPRRSAV